MLSHVSCYFYCQKATLTWFQRWVQSSSVVSSEHSGDWLRALLAHLFMWSSSPQPDHQNCHCLTVESISMCPTNVLMVLPWTPAGAQAFDGLAWKCAPRRMSRPYLQSFVNSLKNLTKEPAGLQAFFALNAIDLTDYQSLPGKTEFRSPGMSLYPPPRRLLSQTK